MPVAFFGGRVLLIHTLRMFIEGLDLHGIAVVEFALNKDMEDRFTLLLDQVRNRLRDQVERDALDLLGRDCRLLLLIGHRRPPRGLSQAGLRSSGWNRSAI